ncbi:hypothetical protein HDF14_000364 [Edaphobacter lichenicola]|uniref:Tn3 transposase DDE domain-containing protein n=1 Tax=Tunturiibacter gelidiferens TaxID=3069689 RepID=A0A9X0U2C7_9BACT|nr:hypothetical protein [Edaphobacter lichenicola]
MGYPRQNGLAVALRELGRIERTLSSSWIGCKSVELRRRVHTGLNKGEAAMRLTEPCSSPSWRDPRPQLRAAAMSRQRAHLGHSRHHVVEHRLPRTSHQRTTRKRAYRRPCAPETLVSARMGAHQPYRRLPMAETPQDSVRASSGLCDRPNIRSGPSVSGPTRSASA